MPRTLTLEQSQHPFPIGTYFFWYLCTNMLHTSNMLHSLQTKYTERLLNSFIWKHYIGYIWSYLDKTSTPVLFIIQNVDFGACNRLTVRHLSIKWGFLWRSSKTWHNEISRNTITWYSWSKLGSNFEPVTCRLDSYLERLFISTKVQPQPAIRLRPTTKSLISIGAQRGTCPWV